MLTPPLVLLALVRDVHEGLHEGGVLWRQVATQDAGPQKHLGEEVRRALRQEALG